ncbi:MAG: biotin--[acetyl-CoA-carboxylase] ligase [Desulfobacterales bacterium]|nr:biotin--[acetyl-CoA-carboxylase] ligase [Desulfobacterales bacterium]
MVDGEAGFYILEWFASTESTNSLALQKARNAAPAWTVVAADTQTGGRGRLKRTWVSPPGVGLYFSVVLRPRLELQELPLVTLAAAVAVCRGVESVCGVSPAIKWPNDLLFDGRKLGGILIESESLTGADQPATIIGIGINVTTRAAQLPSELREQAISLAIATGNRYSRHDLLDAIVKALQTVMDALEGGKKKEVFDQWQARDGLIGNTLTWVTISGQRITGKALGIDDHGHYHIRDQAGISHEVLSGDLAMDTGNLNNRITNRE